MPQRTVFFRKGNYYHVYNRGVAKQNIYLSDKDRKRFLDRSKKYAKKFNIKALSYCLMPNHFHFLLKQQGNDSLADFMRHLLVAYSMYFNKRHERVGPVFQGRFKAKIILKDSYLLQLVRYFHQNPRGILSSGEEISNYKWSSYKNYLGFRKEVFLDTRFVLNYFSKSNPKKDFRRFSEDDIPDQEFNLIRRYTLETGT